MKASEDYILTSLKAKFFMVVGFGIIEYLGTVKGEASTEYLVYRRGRLISRYEGESLVFFWIIIGIAAVIWSIVLSYRSVFRSKRETGFLLLPVEIAFILATFHFVVPFISPQVYTGVREIYTEITDPATRQWLSEKVKEDQKQQVLGPECSEGDRYTPWKQTSNQLGQNMQSIEETPVDRYNTPLEQEKPSPTKGPVLDKYKLKCADLHAMNLQNIQLAYLDLRRAILKETNFYNSNLFMARLEGADLRSANLQLADLQQASLQWANLADANLMEANLAGANLSDVNLQGANLDKSSLLKIRLNGARYDNNTIWPEEFEYKKSGAVGPGAILRRVNLSYTDLNNANLSNTDLSRANLSYAELNDANLSNANLSNANLRGSALRGSVLQYADLNNADLRDAILAVADLSSTNLSYADLRGVILNYTSLNNADLHDSDLRGSVMIYTDLSSANLRNAKYNNETKWPDGFDPQAAGAIESN